MKTTPIPTAAINGQTPGPLFHMRASSIEPGKTGAAVAIVPEGRDFAAVALCSDATTAPPDAETAKKNRHLLRVSYTMADRAARELGIDAAALCESLDLGALIRAARSVVTSSLKDNDEINRLARCTP